MVISSFSGLFWPDGGGAFTSRDTVDSNLAGRWGRMGEWDSIELVCLEASRALWNVQYFLPCLKENPDKLENISSLKAPILRKGRKIHLVNSIQVDLVPCWPEAPAQVLSVLFCCFWGLGQQNTTQDCLSVFPCCLMTPRQDLPKLTLPLALSKRSFWGWNVRQN